MKATNNVAMPFTNNTRVVRSALQCSLITIGGSIALLAIALVIVRDSSIRAAYVPITVKRNESIELLKVVHGRLVKEFGHARQIDAEVVSGWQYNCPLFEFLTHGQINAPLIVVCAYRLRGSTEWRTLAPDETVVPVLFVSQSTEHSELLGQGPVCYGDGRVRIEKLPIYVGSLAMLDGDVVEVHDICITAGLRYTDDIEAFRGVLLGRSQLR